MITQILNSLRRLREPSFNFKIASIDQILHFYRQNGCVLLRNFVSRNKLSALSDHTAKLYNEINSALIFSSDLRNRNLQQFHEEIFAQKHYDLLQGILGKKYCVSEDTASRRIDRQYDITPSPTWQAPLGPHLDAFFHSFIFTVNFWVPFQDCGIDAPSLGVVRATFDEMVAYTGYDGGPDDGFEGNVDFPAARNFACFHPDMKKLAFAMEPGRDLLRPLFGDRVWTPEYRLGDAMMLSNWTLHFTHAPESARHRRSSIELRFRAKG
jgi:hypothetical protein